MNTNILSQHKSQHKSKGKQERIFFTKLLVLSGIFLFLAGLYFLVSSSDIIHKVVQSYHSFFTPSANDTNIVYTISSISIFQLISYFISGFFVLILSIFLSKKYIRVSYLLSLFASGFFILLQLKLAYEFLFHGVYFHNFTEAIIFHFSTVILLFVTGFNLKKISITLISCIYLYFTSFLYIITFGGEVYLTLFGIILVFSVALIWLENTIKRPLIILINFLFFLVFFSFFFTRKFIINSKIEFLPVFFIFGGLFFLLFYFIPIFSARREEKPISQPIQSILIGLNLLYYLGTTGFIFLKFFNYNFLCFFVSFLLIMNIGGQLIIKKNNKNVWLVPYDYSIILLIALIVPIWIKDSRLLLFIGVISPLMLKYSIQNSQKFSFWISVSALVLATLSYLFGYINLVPAMIYDHKTPQTYLLVKGVLTSLFVLGLFWFTKKTLKDAVLPVSEQVLKPRKYIKLIDAFLLTGLFITVGLTIFLIPYFSTGFVKYIGLSWFISGSLFFIYFIQYFKNKRMALKKPTHYAGFVFALLYPALTTVNIFNRIAVNQLAFDFTAIILHYMSLVLFLILSMMVIVRIRKRNMTNPLTLKVIQLLIISNIFFVIFEEYNNFSMAGSFLFKNLDILESESLFLSTNFYFPLTIILSLFATSVNIYSIVKHNTFLRILSIVLMVIAVAKLFILDKSTAPDGKIGTIFILSGIFLVVLALLNSWIVNIINKKKI